MSRVLIVEDENDIAQLIRRYLERAGHTTDVVASGSDALSYLRVKQPDLVILDLMLPGTDGLTVCRAIRRNDSTTSVPIIILSARTEETDRVQGLELGADDYVSKPFSPKELVARVAAIERRARRATGTAASPLRYRSLELDRDRHVVVSAGAEVPLTPKEFLLLEYLMRHRGRVLSRERLLTDVWGYSYAGGTRTVDVHVRRLRKKLPSLQRALSTVHQFGYKLLESASEPEPENCAV